MPSRHTQQPPHSLTSEGRVALRLGCRYRAVTELYDRDFARRSGASELAVSTDPRLRALSSAHARELYLATVARLLPDLGQWAKRTTAPWSLEACLQYLEEANE